MVRPSTRETIAPTICFNKITTPHLHDYEFYLRLAGYYLFHKTIAALNYFKEKMREKYVRQRFFAK